MAEKKTEPRKPDLKVKEYTFAWEGTDRTGKQIKGESRGPSDTVV